ncbi:MAG: hypothetical protein FWC47_11055, partial [Oscillospiraceae bacterium]|nr:hypothetical protein [Oscillospiraceae bacterium]
MRRMLSVLIVLNIFCALFINNIVYGIELNEDFNYLNQIKNWTCFKNENNDAFRFVQCSNIGVAANDLVNSEIFISCEDELKNKVMDNFKVIINDSEEITLKSNFNNIVKLKIGNNKIELIPNDDTIIDESIKNVIVNSSDTRITFNVEKVYKKSNLNIYSTIIQGKGNSSDKINLEIYAKIFKDDVLVREVTIVDPQTLIENLSVGSYKISFFTPDDAPYDITPKERSLNVNYGEQNRVFITVTLKPIAQNQATNINTTNVNSSFGSSSQNTSALNENSTL